MTWKGPAMLPPPEPERSDYIEIQPPRKTREQVAAEEPAALAREWPYSVEIHCPNCEMRFRLTPDVHNSLVIHLDHDGALVRCPNCPPGDRLIYLPRPHRRASRWQRLWRRPE